jgi:exosortase/archaeosortase family protein
MFVAVPWISPIELPIVQGLMRIAAAVATEAITLCGIPAQLEGNLIRVSTGLVGVNEACSGVRSLQTSLMIGLLFGELKRLSVGKRIALVSGAVTLAILSNFGRAFFLVWIAATRGVPAVAEWHDLAGYAIVAVVFLGSQGLSALLGKGGKQRSEVRSQNRASSASDIDGNATSVAESEAEAERIKSGNRAPTSDLRLPTSVLLLFFVWFLAIEVGVEGWYRAHEKDLKVTGGWTVRPPEKAPGFREIKIDEEVRQTLRFDEGREVGWKSGGAGTGIAPATNYLFFFRWNAGAASVLRARAHRPDICLPSAGWTTMADYGTKIYRGPGEIQIPARHVVFKQTGGNGIAHTFFCLQEDKIHSSETRPDLELSAGVQPEWSMAARARVVRNGIRNLGQQVLEAVVISATPMGETEARARFQELVREAVVAK